MSESSPAPAAGRGPPYDAEQVDALRARHAALFQACVAEAQVEEPDLEIAGRRVELMLTVNPSGNAVYPTLDDVQLRDTQLGRCLKHAGTRMQFPPFDGAPARVRLPLTLGR